MINIQSNDEEGSKICVRNQKNVMETAMTGHKDISCDGDNAIDVSFCPLLQSQFFFIFHQFWLQIVARTHGVTSTYYIILNYKTMPNSSSGHKVKRSDLVGQALMPWFLASSNKYVTNLISKPCQPSRLAFNQSLLISSRWSSKSTTCCHFFVVT